MSLGVAYTPSRKSSAMPLYCRRSAKLLEHLEQCMAFYQIQPYLRGGIPCKQSGISVDEVVVFRLSEKKQLS